MSCDRSSWSLQVRIGRVIVHNGRLLQVTKAEHTQGHGRQLGNVQVHADSPVLAASLSTTIARYRIFCAAGAQGPEEAHEAH